MTIGDKPIRQAAKIKQQLHLYAGISYYGVTSLYPVTGTSGVKSRYLSAKGSLCKGLGATEYCHLLQSKLLPAMKDMLKYKCKNYTF